MRKWPQAMSGDVQVGHQEKFLHRRGCQVLERAAQGGSGVTISQGVQGTTGHGTQCSGLFNKVVMDQRLYSMILEVFSNF